MIIKPTSHPGLLALSFAAVFSASAHAQQAPDAGQILQELQPPVASPRESKPLSIQAPVPSTVSPGGAVVVVQAVRFTGNSVISQDALQTALGDVAGRSFDLAGLRGLAERTSDLYHASGFPFARAILPPQDLQQGVLRIEIIEGRYGLVQAESEDVALALQATPFLSRLQPGTVIESTALERSSLLLDDLPGIKTAPLIRPGTQTGTGDLMVQVSRDERVTGDVGLDNAGSRYTGQIRARANLNINSPFMLGDQISIRTLVSDEQLWLGSLGYSRPLGSSGLRGNVSYSHTSYVLAKEFADLHANGTAKVTSAGLSYPLVRSQKTNLTLIGAYQAKDLKDNQDSINTHESKSSESVPIALQFDHRDSAGGGGITYGSVAWTPGNLQLDSGLSAVDANNTRGSFNKFNLDVVRLQSLPADFSLMGRLSLQAADQNLDSSEKMILGGAGGVRAYPTGEASGDEGVLAQLELRYNAGAYTPYVFWDGGSIRTNAKPIATTATDNKRSVSGSGVGVRYLRDGWSADATLAWHHVGGAPQADTSSDPTPRVWVNLGYRF
ncbi:MAG: ShlB/FhaC/HecB family hemolysin secretion/activation protein [Pseudomonas sp.]